MFHVYNECLTVYQVLSAVWCGLTESWVLLSASQANDQTGDVPTFRHQNQVSNIAVQISSEYKKWQTCHNVFVISITIKQKSNVKK